MSVNAAITAAVIRCANQPLRALFDFLEVVVIKKCPNQYKPNSLAAKAAVKTQLIAKVALAEDVANDLVTAL